MSVATIYKRAKNTDGGVIIGLPTTDGYDKRHYKWDPQLKKTVYVNAKGKKSNIDKQKTEIKNLNDKLLNKYSKMLKGDYKEKFAHDEEGRELYRQYDLGDFIAEAITGDKKDKYNRAFVTEEANKISEDANEYMTYNLDPKFEKTLKKALIGDMDSMKKILKDYYTKTKNSLGTDHKWYRMNYK